MGQSGPFFYITEIIQATLFFMRKWDTKGQLVFSCVNIVLEGMTSGLVTPPPLLWYRFVLFYFSFPWDYHAYWIGNYLPCSDNIRHGLNNLRFWLHSQEISSTFTRWRRFSGFRGCHYEVNRKCCGFNMSKAQNLTHIYPTTQMEILNHKK